MRGSLSRSAPAASGPRCLGRGQSSRRGAIRAERQFHRRTAFCARGASNRGADPPSGPQQHLSRPGPHTTRPTSLTDFQPARVAPDTNARDFPLEIFRFKALQSVLACFKRRGCNMRVVAKLLAICSIVVLVSEVAVAQPPPAPPAPSSSKSSSSKPLPTPPAGSKTSKPLPTPPSGSVSSKPVPPAPPVPSGK
jgi:hypothetical protein